MVSRLVKKYLLLIMAVLAIGYFTFFHSSGITSGSLGRSCLNSTNQVSRKTSVYGADRTLFEYDRNSGIIFVGGVARSGSTLVRSILDEHPDINCHDETVILPKVLQMRHGWSKSQRESMRLAEAGMSGDVLDSAFSVLILEVLARLDEPNIRLCNKDLAILKYGTYLKQLFPKSKFLFIVRDARATVHSIVTHKLTLPGYDVKSYRTSLLHWNNETSTMNKECESLGPSSCLRVYYEQLVLHPLEVLTKIGRFLDLKLDDTTNLTKMSKQINPEALSKWVGQIPDDILQNLETIAPMLNMMGYTSNSDQPNYASLTNK